MRGSSGGKAEPGAAPAGFERLEPQDPELMMPAERETENGPIKGLEKPSESVPSHPCCL